MIVPYRARQHMHHIFRDHAVLQQDSCVLLAVLGWQKRLEAFDAWMTEHYPGVTVENTKFDYEPFGEAAERVFELYDVILRLHFPSEGEAQQFVEAWPTRGHVADLSKPVWSGKFVSWDGKPIKSRE
jgi:hypothetical protein